MLFRSPLSLSPPLPVQARRDSAVRAGIRGRACSRGQRPRRRSPSTWGVQVPQGCSHVRARSTEHAGCGTLAHEHVVPLSIKGGGCRYPLSIKGGGCRYSYTAYASPSLRPSVPPSLPFSHLSLLSLSLSPSLSLSLSLSLCKGSTAGRRRRSRSMRRRHRRARRRRRGGAWGGGGGRRRRGRWE